MAVKERPILFSGEMVRAILDGRKTQTRRVVKPQPSEMNVWHGAIYEGEIDLKKTPCMESRSCPYGVPGDRLWVQEEWCDKCANSCYAADGKKWGCEKGRVISPKLMSHRESRSTLEIIAVRVERLQDISEEDAKAEGAICAYKHNEPQSYRDAFHSLWDLLYTKRGCGWDANPWVWVIEFRRIENA